MRNSEDLRHRSRQVRDLVTGVPLQQLLQQDMAAYDRACEALDELELSPGGDLLAAARELAGALTVDVDTTPVDGETPLVVARAVVDVVTAELEERINTIYSDGGTTLMLPVLADRAAEVDLVLLRSTAWDDPADTVVADDVAAAWAVRLDTVLATAERRFIDDVARIDVEPAQSLLRRIRAYARGATTAPSPTDMQALMAHIAHLTVLAADSDKVTSQRLPGWTPPT